MNQGELWTAMGGSEFLSKPRPALIIQSDEHQAIDSVIVCPLTSSVGVVARYRVTLEASIENGLEHRSAIMIDKTVAVSRSRLGQRIGRLQPTDMVRVHAALAAFLQI